MSLSRKRAAAAAAVSDEGEEAVESEEDLWGEEEAEAPTARQPRKRTRQSSLIEDVVGGEEEEEGGGGGDDVDELNDGFDEDLYGDDDDRAHLASLPEVEREAILYQRAEKRRELEERREAKRKATSGQVGSRPPIGMRGRTRGAGGRSGGSSLPDALADLIARRHKQTTSKPSDSVVLAGDDDDDEEVEMVETTRRRQQQSRRQRRSRAPSREQQMDTDDDEADEVDVADQREAEETVEEETEKERRKAEARFSIPGSHTPLRLSDLKLIQLRRDRLEKIHEEPFFADVVKGMFVRVTIGHDHSRNAPKYKVGEVVGQPHHPTLTLTTPHHSSPPSTLSSASLLPLTRAASRCAGVGEMRQKYPFPPGTSRTTRVSLMLQRGDARRLFAMSAISNQSITDEEFTGYVAEMKKAGQPLLTAEEALERKKKAEFVRDTYVYTPQLVAQMIEEKKGRGSKHANVTLERTKLDIELARARSAVDSLKQRIRAKGKRDTGGEQRERDEDDEGGGGGEEGEEELALQAEERRLEGVENRLAELREVELKQAKTAKGRAEMANIVELNRRNQSRDIEEARSMFFNNERVRREEEEQLRAQGKTRQTTLDPFKRRATRPSMNFEEEKEAEPAREEKKIAPDDDEDDTAAHTSAADSAVPVGSPVVVLGGGSVRGGGSGLLAFGHPPSLSELMLAQLQLSHQVGGDVDVERTGEVRGAAGTGRRDGNRVWHSKYSALPANERVLSISDYWARREQA